MFFFLKKFFVFNLTFFNFFFKNFKYHLITYFLTKIFMFKYHLKKSLSLRFFSFKNLKIFSFLKYSIYFLFGCYCFILFKTITTKFWYILFLKSFICILLIFSLLICCVLKYNIIIINKTYFIYSIFILYLYIFYKKYFFVFL